MGLSHCGVVVQEPSKISDCLLCYQQVAKLRRGKHSEGAIANRLLRNSAELSDNVADLILKKH